LAVGIGKTFNTGKWRIWKYFIIGYLLCCFFTCP